MKKLTSLSIDYLRFPMAALVVICHCMLLYGISWNGTTVYSTGPVSTWLQIFISEVLPHIAVPMFAMISGYLFFIGVKDFNMETYKGKIGKRLKTLILPYVLWCSIAYLLSALQGSVDFSFVRWVQGCWNAGLWNDTLEGMTAFTNFPANMPLWFMRDLIMMMILTPVIWFIIKKAGIIPVAAAGIWWYINVAAHTTGFNSTIVFFFMLGAYFSIKEIDLADFCLKFKWPLYGITFPLVIVDYVILIRTFVPETGLNHNWWVFNAYVFFGVFAAFALCASVLKKRMDKGVEVRKSALSQTSFFIFATHALFYPQLTSWLYGIFRPASDMGYLLLYIFVCVLVIGLCIGGYFLFKKFLPKTCGVLTGNR